MNANWKYGLRWQTKRDTAFEHSSACEIAAALRLPAQSQTGAHARGVEVILANHRCGNSEPALNTSDPASAVDEVRCNKWELFALVSFIVLSFAGLLFCFYVIAAKCRGTWPF